METEAIRAPLLNNQSESTQAQGQVERPNVLIHLLIAAGILTTSTTLSVVVLPSLLLKAADDSASRSAVYSGIIASSQAILTIFVAPFLGALSDSVGRKPIFILSHAGYFLGYLIIAQFPTLLIAQVVGYFFITLSSAYSALVRTIIADIAQEPINVTTYYGYFGAVTGVCFLIGPVTSGMIEDSFYLASSLHVSCILVILAAIYAFCFVPETLPTSALPLSTDQATNATANAPIARGSMFGRAVRATQWNPLPRIISFCQESVAMRWLCLLLATFALIGSGLESILYLYGYVTLHWDTKEYGIVLSIFGLLLLVTQGVFVKPTVRYLGQRKTIMASLIGCAASMVAFGMARTEAMMLLAVLISMFGFLFNPAFQGIICRLTSTEKQGGLQGSVTAVIEVVRPVSPLLANLMFSFGVSIGFVSLPFVVWFVINMGCAWIARKALWDSDFRDS